ncbi:UDP-N-acetylglucosamine transporter-like [Phytophthora cinnamomi]|uniref:UDP-N-acetylglucosamine transporter-like n=1 Tax=Phytophthora cinnamomi TaxID=4785 RepID=UPI003559B8DC|nr:UDP-N-acetylglucosamine transporter-like [Phytophthora cinnamomi]
MSPSPPDAAPPSSKRKQLSDAAPARKLRKSCSLPTCTSPPGTCMHCTCDGRCGRHASGRCGGRREGSGRGCKREGCTRDDRCLHSNRATCCHCRNLVSSAGRAAKRPRVTAPLLPQTQARVQPPMLPVYRYRHFAVPAGAATDSKPTATSDEQLEAELRAFLQDANLGGDLSLCEFQEYAARRQYCNLVVLVCGTQFNLHKHPMLLESRKLHRMARQVLDAGAADSSSFGGAVPALELSAFPGGAEVFETLAIYCYTGEISFSLANLAAMNCAIEFLEMRNAVRQSAKRFLDLQISGQGEGLSKLLQVVNAAKTLAQAQPELFRSACETLVDTCMAVLVARGAALDADAMLQLFTLPSELFIELTQRVLSAKPPTSSSVRSTAEIASELCVQAKLAQLHRDAQRSLSPTHCNRILAQQCVELLQGASVEAVDAIKTEKLESCEEEPLDLTALLASDKSDKVLIKLMDDDLSSCAVLPGSPRVDASICLAADSFHFGAHALPETFVV